MALRISRKFLSQFNRCQKRFKSDEKPVEIRWADPNDYDFPSPNRFFRAGPKQYEGYLNIDFIVSLQRKIDFSSASIKRWLERKDFERHIAFQSAISERRSMYGSEIGAATFILQLNGAVKFNKQDNWVKVDKNKKKPVLPSMPVRGTSVVAVDASNSNIMYEGLDNIIGLKKLTSLNLSGSPYIDDWCLDKISARMRKNLRHLDVSKCPNVTEKGLFVLHRLKNLRYLNIKDMPKVEFPPLVSILLEEAMPDCKIDGFDYMKGWVETLPSGKKDESTDQVSSKIETSESLTDGKKDEISDRQINVAFSNCK